MDEALDLVIDMLNLIWHYNHIARDAVVAWIWVSQQRRGLVGGRVFIAVRGPNARTLSNALYHAFRAIGGRRVRRWQGKHMWYVAFSQFSFFAVKGRFNFAEARDIMS